MRANYRFIVFGLMALAISTGALVLGTDPALAAAAFGKATAFPSLDYVSMAGASLVALRTDLTDLTARAAAKIGEVKDGLAPDAIRAIETEHAELLRQIEAKKAEIATAEDEARSQPAPGLGEDAVRAAAASAAAQAVAAERTRSSTITTLAERHGLRAFGDEHVAMGTDVETFRTALLDKLAAEQPTERNHVVGPANADSRAAAMQGALLHRFNMTAYPLTDDARNFRGMTLLEMARSCLEAHGVSTVGMPRHDVAARALAGSTRSGGMMSTSDFPMILANVANKTLRAAYEQSPQTFRPLVKVVSLPDFKTISRTQLGEAPAFERVNENGEFKRGSMGEAREQYSLLTYGKVVAVTRQVIINDDMDALTRLPAAFGMQAANLESDLVWAQIVGNPTMGDNVALFHADHGNLGTAAGLSVDSLGLAREAMRLQKGLDGATLLNITPTHVIVPVAAETKLAQLLTSITPAVSTNAVPDYIRSLTPIVEPRLDGGFRNPVTGATVAGSRFAWYLASTGVIDMIELGYLEGTQGVFMETRTGFDVDGMELKVRLDVGSKAIDWRPFYKNPATAL